MLALILDDQQMEEQLEDSDSLKESTENVLQKTNINNIDQDIKYSPQNLMKLQKLKY